MCAVHAKPDERHAAALLLGSQRALRGEALISDVKSRAMMVVVVVVVCRVAPRHDTKAAHVLTILLPPPPTQRYFTVW